MIKLGQELLPRDSRMLQARVTRVDGCIVTVRMWDTTMHRHALVTYPGLDALDADYYVALPGATLTQEQLDKLLNLLSHHSSTGEFGGPGAESDSQNEIFTLVEEIVQTRTAQLEARIASALEALEASAFEWEELEPEVRSAIRALKGES